MKITRLQALQGLSGLIAAPALSTAARAADSPSMVRLGINPAEAACVAYYAKENGYFDKAGLNVDVTISVSTPAIAAALVAGSYDIGYATLSTLVVAHVKGLPFVIIAPSGLNLPGHVQSGIMLPIQSSIKSGADFNGKIFATPGLNTLGEYLPRAWIDKHGGDSSTVKFVEIPFPQIADALAAGRADAAYLVEPFITIAEKRNVARLFLTGDEAIAPTFLASAFYTTAQWAKANPEVIARFTDAITQAARWANANPTKVVPILTNYLKADPVVTAAAQRTYYADRLVSSQIQPVIDITAKYGKFPPFPATDIIYSRSR